MVRSRKLGFTIIELLVVIAIIAVLVVLLMPAVQQAREAARRTQCKDNLKQFGVALHNYHEVMGEFPDANYLNLWSSDPSAANSEWSWSVMLLPYFDQAVVFNALNVGTGTFEQAANDPVRLRLMQKSPPVFLCPSDSGSEINVNRPFIAKTKGGIGYGMILDNTISLGKSNYMGCNGNHGNDGIFDSGDPTRVSVADITDGLSNTIMVGERSSPAWNSQPPGTQGPWAGIWAGQESTPNDTTNVWCLVGKTEFQMNTGAPSGVAASTSNVPLPIMAFGSTHSGGAHFLMGDGSVRFISDKIQWNDRPNSYDDVGIYHLLGSRADGMSIGEF